MKKCPECGEIGDDSSIFCNAVNLIFNFIFFSFYVGL